MEKQFTKRGKQMDTYRTKQNMRLAGALRPVVLSLQVAPAPARHGSCEAGRAAPAAERPG